MDCSEYMGGPCMEMKEAPYLHLEPTAPSAFAASPSVLLPCKHPLLLLLREERRLMERAFKPIRFLLCSPVRGEGAAAPGSLQIHTWITGIVNEQDLCLSCGGSGVG